MEMRVHPGQVNIEAGGAQRVRAEAETRFKAKNGSVFPKKKKKLVKKRMLDCVVKFFPSLFTSFKASQSKQTQMQKVKHC
ncbi:Uncharacterized protein TCM_035245 [Theobroma cacao]|uniref:Uncharacterized protein n=1 Tax=Theobroma cacao TaxID=3641 RepID=A0A061FHC3_THECC|nr:Uncharacterized protein TCM_035245 [Theobroma cacao]